MEADNGPDSMAKKPEPGSIKGPGGMSMSELHALVKKSHARDQATSKHSNKLKEPQNRWQRFVRYTWDKNRGRG
jgi:hypothetical protein